MLTAEQLKLRARTLGASEVAAAIGLNPYQTPWETWAQKRGLVPPTAETPAMRLGNLMEPVVLALYRDQADGDAVDEPGLLGFPMWRRTGVEFSEVVGATYVRDGWQSATPDGLRRRYTPEGALEFICLVECKTTDLRGAAEWADGAAPLHYVVQAQWQMHVLGVARVDLACLVAGRTLIVRSIMRDDESIAEIVRRATTFWQHVTGGTEPPKPYGSDTFAEHLARKYPSATEGMLPTTEYVTDWVARYTAARDAAKRAETAKAEAAAVLCEVIGPHKGIGDLDVDGYRATWTEQKGTTDWKAAALLAGATPEQIAQSARPPTRVLRVRTKTEE